MKMRLTALLLLLVFLPVAALADGGFFPPSAFPAKITIPDQQALICFSNGVERLVIETRFTGPGTNFAWVVPLPSQPVVEEATIGLFPTLQYLFQPKITHSVTPFYKVILVLIVLVYLLRKRTLGEIFAILLLLFVLAGLLLPALATAGMAVSSAQSVSVLDRKIVGIFETATIASRDAKALQYWLSENGFSLSTNAEPAIVSYVKDGWVFVVAKIRRDDAGFETSTPHPLSFTFKTDQAVYPMRLTGADNDSLKVELYVFGPARAEASHFKVERCTKPNYPNPPPDDQHGLAWAPWLPETPNIVHPLLRRWVEGAPVATKLVATLSASDMRQDVWLDWTTFAEKKNHLFSKSGALTTALNWAVGLLGLGLVAIYLILFFDETHKAKLLRLLGTMVTGCLIVGGLVYLCLPKTAVRLVKMPGIHMRMHLSDFRNMLYQSGATNLMGFRAQASLILSDSTNNLNATTWAQSSNWQISLNNYFLGGQIREEDSPGNYLLRETNGTVELVVFDAQGAEHTEF
jgi:hypothetical protein